MNKIDITDEMLEYKITVNDIENIETIKQGKLPKDYKEFLLKHNGGEANFDAFEIKNSFPGGGANISSIRYFFGICHDTESAMYGYDLFYNMKIYTNRIPEELLPIASDSFGNNICIGINEENYGKIYFWDHEEEADSGADPWWENITLIANSFTDLMNNLFQHELDDDNQSILTLQDGTIRVI